MTFYIGYGCALAAILGYIVLSARWLKRNQPPRIDLTGLTVDPEPESATVSDILDRLEPYHRAADEAIAVTKPQPQDFRDAAEVRWGWRHR